MTTLVEKRLCEICKKKRTVPEEIRPKGTHCVDCKKKNKRQWARERYKQDPSKKLEYAKRYYIENKEKVQAKQKDSRASSDYRERNLTYSRERRARIKADPQAYEEFLKRSREDQRIARREKWEKEGRMLEPVSLERYRRYNKMPRVEYPIAPLLPFLEQWLAEHSQVSLSRQSGVPERRIYDYMHIQKNASMISIEKLCHAMGITLDLVYDQSDDLEEISDDGDLCA